MPAAAAQQTPEDGEKVPLGADITLPCSCDGNKCTMWPLPDTVPQGFRYEERKKTSFLERGYMIEGRWQTTAGVGGTYVDEPWKGGRCKALAGNGAATENPVGPISITSPGTYRLRIITTEFSGVADCRYAQCATVTLTKSNTTTEDRYFTVEPEPEKGCNDKHNRISQVTDAEGNALDEGARLSMGLGAPLFMRGQTVRVPQGMRGVEVQFEDGSVVRYTGGTVVRINDCPSESSEPSMPVKMRMSLILGAIWAQILKVAGPERAVEVDTPFIIVGNRGTTFSVEYDAGSRTTTVEVEEGSVWVRNKVGAQKTVVANTGQTVTATGSGPPRLR